MVRRSQRTAITLQQLEGDWQSSSGGIKTITEGCYNGSAVTLRRGKLLHGDFAADVISGDEVVWKIDGCRVSWKRCQQQLDGTWLSSIGGIRVVTHGQWRGSAITSGTDKFAHESATAIALSRNELSWDVNGNCVTWRRWHLHELDGDWLSSSGNIKTVVDGYFAGSVIMVQNGDLMHDGFIGDVISDDVLIWNINHKNIIWRRWQLELLDGNWLSSSGGIRTITNCHYKGCAVTLKDGQLMHGPATAVEVSDGELIWKVGDTDEMVTWRRWQLLQLEGDWESSWGGIKTIKNGRYSGSVVTLQDGHLLHEGHTAQVISDDKVIWDIQGQVVIWHRCDPKKDTRGTLAMLQSGPQARLSSSCVKVLYHATRESNAQQICRQQLFLPGSDGFLGPGIYFSESARNAKRWCQCCSGCGPIVVLRCNVVMGCMRSVCRGSRYNADRLIREGVDSLKEIGRDCYMLPSNDDNQICMDSIAIEYL